MPPSMSRSSLSALARCQKCSTSSSSTRNFSSSTPRAAIGPESPKFIEIPQPLQRYARPPRDIKGTLPPPRNLFPRRAGDKTSPEYFAKVTPEPSAARDVSSAQNDYSAYKRRMAATRRAHLREGLVQLHQRKVAAEQEVAKRSAEKRRHRDALVRAPQREDERLTNPTITAAMSQLQVGRLPDPEREQRIAEAAARAEAKAAKATAARMDALHTLYMNARSFITTEAQLDAEIDRLFVEKPFENAFRGGRTDNVWDAYGPPPTVQDMLTSVNGTQKSAVLYHRGPAEVTGQRVRKIAEELTGGKMD